ncbi:GntR family transcriptional regulator [Planococcus salinus]|uniref:GntR family transcriptional regulator n=1 Tax=Planococcus salinus TaxID=1848460 RepID=A0A3M8P3Z4_9BACL|nr:GntR family transcriptional regulator [Planococcus salinus]RNF38387.1 GntR family transcriptional regulator [Planococcus salinus]
MEKIATKATLAEQAYEYIKKMIITGELDPGEELPEEKLAAELGISRTPLREALRRLAVDALIELRKTRPAVVAGFNHEDVKEIMEIRRLLEIHNLEHLSKADQQRVIPDLRENAARQLKAVKENDYVCFMDTDQEFHALLYSSNSNKRMKEMIYTVNTGGSRAFLLLSETICKSAVEAYHEHLSIIEAIEKGDIEAAKQQMALHLKNIEKRLLEYIK